jgi:hypothetical protein
LIDLQGKGYALRPWYLGTGHDIGIFVIFALAASNCLISLGRDNFIHHSKKSVQPPLILNADDMTG